MTYLALIIVLVGLAFSLYYTKADLFSPAVLTCLVWLGAICVYLFVPNDLPPVSTQLVVGMSIWLGGFLVSSVLLESVPLKVTQGKAASSLIRDIYVILSAITILGLYRWAWLAIKAHPDENWAMVLRLTSLGKKGYADVMYGGTQIFLWQVSYLLELFYFTKKRWYRIIIPCFCVCSWGLLTMSKAAFVALFVMSIVLIVKKYNVRIKLKYVLVTGALLMSAFVFLQTQRGQMFDLSKLLLIYLASGLYAFGTLSPCSSSSFGLNTGVFVYILAYKLHLTSTPPVSPILAFIKEPIETNTYTTLYPFFVDFGMIGIGMFALLLGLLAGCLYRYVKRGNSFAAVFYAYLAPSIVMQYAAESILTNIMGHIRVLFLLWVAFVFVFPVRNNPSVLK